MQPLTALKNTTTIRQSDIQVELGAKTTHGIVNESNVDVLYMRATDGSGERLVRVKVWSAVRKGLFRFTDIKCAGNSESEMTQKCGYAAAACAEGLCVLYGDTIDPGRAAASAVKHFEELVEFLRKEQQKVGAAPVT